MKRQQFNTVLFGTNGTGKTTFMLEIAIEYIKNNPGKNVLFVLPDDSERKYDSIPLINSRDLYNISGIYKIYADEYKEETGKTVYESIYNYFVKTGAKRKFNGLLVNDDCGVLWNRRPEDVLKLFRRRRQANMDVLSNFHGLTTDMPPKFLGFITSLILFKTGDSHIDTMNKLPALKQKEFEEMYFRVETETEKNPFYKEELIIRKI